MSQNLLHYFQIPTLYKNCYECSLSLLFIIVIIHSIYGVKKFHSLTSEFHSIQTPEWKFTTQRVESRPVHSILTPKEVITEVTPQGGSDLSDKKSENSLHFNESIIVIIIIIIILL